jgi:Rieske 2Fe-2S family protein
MLLARTPTTCSCTRLPLSTGRTRVVCEWLFTQEAMAQPNDPSDMVEFWDVTNRQDWELCERAQLRAISAAIGRVVSAQRDCVHTFDRWYADRMAGVL